MIRFGSCRRAAFEILRAHVESWRTAERWLFEVSHLLISHAIIPADVQQPGTDECPMVLHQAQGPAPYSGRKFGARAKHKSLPIARDNVFIDGCMNQARVSTPRCAFPGDRDSKTARKQGFDKKNQERSAYRPQSEDRHRGADISASRHRVQAVRHSEATNQWRQPRWRCVSSCDVLDLLGYVLVAVF